jgi:hypothetical protein
MRTTELVPQGTTRATEDAPVTISPHFFLAFPQRSFIVHSFRTARPQFSVAAQSEMRESSFTASVKVALPVIVQGWFCGD